MTKDQIDELIRENGIVVVGEAVYALCNLVEEQSAAAEREKVARWQIGSGYTTGHGDTIEDLLVELEWQVRESEREACARVAESYEPRCDICPSGVSNAIRARREQ